MKKIIFGALLWLLTGAALAQSSGPNGVSIGPAFLQQTVGTWTPVDASGAGLVFTGSSAGYTRTGNLVSAYANITYPTTVNTAAAVIGGFPFNFANAQYARQCTVSASGVAGLGIIPTNNAATITFVTGTAATSTTNANFSGLGVFLNCIYPIS